MWQEENISLSWLKLCCWGMLWVRFQVVTSFFPPCFFPYCVPFFFHFLLFIILPPWISLFVFMSASNTNVFSMHIDIKQDSRHLCPWITLAVFTRRASSFSERTIKPVVLLSDWTMQSKCNMLRDREKEVRYIV